MDIYERTALVLGEEAMQVLARSRVAVFGLGGVGGMWWRRWRAAASARWI